MAEVYLHVNEDDADDVVQCGLKLSKWGCITINDSGEGIRYIPAYLNPKDDKEHFGKEGYTCLRIHIENDYCKVGNYFLYTNDNELLKSLFEQTIIPVDDYIFGTYRKPVCLISKTVKSDNIDIVNKARDIPILVDNSVELYLRNMIRNKADENYSYLDSILYSYYSDLADKGVIIKIESVKKGIGVFINKDKQMVTLKIPETEELKF